MQDRKRNTENSWSEGIKLTAERCPIKINNGYYTFNNMKKKLILTRYRICVDVSEVCKILVTHLENMILVSILISAVVSILFVTRTGRFSCRYGVLKDLEHLWNFSRQVTERRCRVVIISIPCFIFGRFRFQVSSGLLLVNFPFIRRNNFRLLTVSLNYKQITKSKFCTPPPPISHIIVGCRLFFRI